VARRGWLIPLLIFAALAQPALGAPVPPPIVRIIAEAAKTKNPDTLNTTADLAKKAAPESAAEIDALVGRLKSEAAAATTARLASQGVFEGWTGEGELGGSLTAGTRAAKAFSAGVNLTKDGLKWRHKLTGAADYQSSDGVTSAERYRAAYEGNYKITPRAFVLGLVQWEQDRFAGFVRRFTESLGAGYALFDRSAFKWQISGGPALRQTRLVTHQSESDVSAHAETIATWTIDDSTSLSENAGLYIGGSDSTYSSTTALTTALMGNLSGRASFNVMTETNPPPGIANTNTITRFTLVYHF
jgi:putative salt-induced outer membrane protein